MIWLLHQLYEAAAREHPDRVAVRDGARELDYATLDRRANRLAALLAARGVRRGDRVGLLLDKSAAAVVAVVATLKAGAAFVPLDPAAPPRRLGHLLRDCGVELVITNARGVTAADGAPVRATVVLDEDGASTGGPAEQPAYRPDVPGIDRDLAYVLYTSGSTGQPKGVMLSHANALAFVRWAVEEFAISAADRIACPAPLHFDLSVFDLFAAAAAGAATVVVPHPATIFPVETRRFLEREGITVWYSVPSLLGRLALRGGLRRGGLPSLRTVLFAGEVFPVRPLHRLMTALPGVTYYNLYGPTETNVCTFHRVERPPDPDGEPLPIGSPIANVEVLVLAEDGMPVPPGEVGEACVRGATVMLGYWGDAGQTAHTMAPLPGRQPPDLLYRTGDLIRWTERGLRFLGRRDHQIKTRGYRVELGEVEAALQAHPLVAEAAAVAVPDPECTNRIVAFVTTGEPSDDEGDPTPAELAGFCADRLPHYMVPDRITVLAGLPRTSTAKVDRRALAALAARQDSREEAGR